MNNIINLNDYKKKIVEKKYSSYEDDDIEYIVGWIKEFGPIQNSSQIEWDEGEIF